jgi:transaldolase
MPDATIAAFQNHGHIARTIDQGVDDARATLDQLSRADVDLAVLSGTLEREGVEAFAKSFQDALSAIEMKLAEVSRR